MKRLAAVFAILMFIGIVTVSCESKETKRTKHFEKGMEYLDEEKFNEAVIELKNATQADPKFEDAHYQLALIYLKQKAKNFFPEPEVASCIPRI